MPTLKPESIKYLVVHHSATARDSTTFESVKKYHVQKGWGDIGYHYFITGDGKLWNGRAENVVGAHASAGGMNMKSLGICLAGDFTKETPSEVQLKTLADILTTLMQKYKVDRQNILGHREVPEASTACPGERLLTWLHAFKQNKNPTSEVEKKDNAFAVAQALNHLEQAVDLLKHVYDKSN